MQKDKETNVKKTTRVMQIIAIFILILVVVAGAISFLDEDQAQNSITPSPVEKNPFG